MTKHLALLALLLPGLAALASPAHAGIQLYGYQESASTTEGTIRGTGLRLRWLADPGFSMGGAWYLRPGAELSYGRVHSWAGDHYNWEGTGLSRVEFRGEAVGVYLQGGLGRVQMSGRSATGTFRDSDVTTHGEIGLRLREGVHMDVGLRYQRYHDAGITFRGIVIGLGI